MRFLNWKLQRELKVIAHQIRAVGEFFTEPWCQRRHDSQRFGLLKQGQGKVDVGDKLAIFLLYQPAGVPESVLWTCEHLVKQGYAPMVISNAPLIDADKQRLAAVSWKTIERPNFGYDFGGYRDGLWLLDEWGIVPEKLLIINDSIWFPLDADDTLISQMEACPADFVGALELGVPRWPQSSARTKKPFFGSFFFMLKRPALCHPAFKKFWALYRLTSNKLKTVKRGELGLSRAMACAGISAEGLYSRQKFDDYLETIDAKALRALLSDLVAPDHKLQKKIAACLVGYEASSDWLDAARGLALEATEKKNILVTAPIASLIHFNVPYLKKGSDRHQLRILALVKQKIESGELNTIHPLISGEIKNWLALIEK